MLSSIGISANVQATLVSASPNLSGNLMLSDQSNVNPGVGSAVNQSDGRFTSSGSIVAGTPLVINLESLLDPFGSALTVGHIVGIKITNTSTPGSGSINHGGGSNPVYATQSLAIDPGDFFAHSFNTLGLSVTSGTAQNLTLSATTGTVTYKITLLVRSA